MAQIGRMRSRLGEICDTIEGQYLALFIASEIGLMRNRLWILVAGLSLGFATKMVVGVFSNDKPAETIRPKSVAPRNPAKRQTSDSSDEKKDESTSNRG